MNKKISLGAAIAFMLIVATATFAMTMIFATNNFNQTVVALKERENQFEKYSEIDRQVRQKYNGTINETQLMDNVARGYLSGIGDPYATYITARDYERLQRQAQGQIAGIGALLEANVDGDGFLVVKQVYADSPALAAGIEAGDLIVKIDDSDLTPENSAWMLESVQGEAGTKITVVVRRGSEELAPMDMTRRQVAVPTVHSSMIEGTTIAYVWIEEFNDNTSDQFNRELQRLLRNNGATGFIFDVRDNKGGVLPSAVRILDRLLPEGVIASYSTRYDDTPVVYTSDEANQLSMPMVVLVNGNTASAAELFAVALRDFENANYVSAKVVGTTTSGKGVIQETIKLNDGSAISITVAELLGPSYETFNGEGVKPDFEVNLGPEENWIELEREADVQLAKALEVILGMQKTGTAAEGSDEQTQPETSVPDEPSQSESQSSEGDESSQEESSEQSDSSQDEENSQQEEQSEED